MEDPAAPGAGSPPTNGNGNGGGKGKPAAPKGREAFRSQRRESEVRSPEGFQLGPGDTRGGKRPREMSTRWAQCEQSFVGVQRKESFTVVGSQKRLY